jgi:hypothetical protein
MAARAQLEQMRRALPSGAMPGQAMPGQGMGTQPQGDQDKDTRSGGLYL